MSEIIGVGAEITECLRVARMIDRYGEQFVDRVFTKEEVRFCGDRKFPSRHFAAHWAAKQAVLRALGLSWGPGINWRDMEIRSNGSGGWTVALRGAVRDHVEQIGATRILVAMAHCRTYATGYATALGARSNDD